ncbi:MAG TPA: glycosyltransferase [Acidimicrobiales bacterium]|nr:glycosyltransferase [Acidimicrobiales bacterium]
MRVDGKHFQIDGRRFRFRGVTYGTFADRGDGALYPVPHRVDADFAAIAAAGFTVVRTYTVPPEDVLDAARAHGLHLLVNAFTPDWRYAVDGDRRSLRALERSMVQNAEAAARALAGRAEVLGITVGNEVPADAVRWFGRGRIERTLRRSADAIRRVDPDRLVSYANYPSTEYLALEGMDFCTFNVFLERRDDFRRYLTRLQLQAGDRPLVLGEIGLHVGDDEDGERRQAELLDWQLELATERGVAGTCIFSWTDEWVVGGTPVDGWRFGLTRADRAPRPALEVARRWNHRTVADLDVDWPAISVVICAYNAAATIEECLEHTCDLDYPALDIVVIDDGSTDDTAAIARRHPRARVVSIEHGGLSVARNEGIRQARGEIVAYLDSDAYPTPEWPYLLALGFDGPTIGGVGGPNVPPPADGIGAQRVAHAPGGPVHVLTADDRAEHIPGCNMAFWKVVLEEVGGFDPVYDAAGDDVDLCWKVLDRGWDIGFHPAAMVWHHRRTGLRPYLRQQRGYGRAEALVETRHPDRFTPLGTARWRGRIYESLAAVAPSGRARIYRGPFGAAGYQSIYRDGGHVVDLVHQVGAPVAAIALATAPAAFVHPGLGVPALAALALLVGLLAFDTLRTRPPAQVRTGRAGFRLAVAAHHLLQPMARAWGRVRHGPAARRGRQVDLRLPAPAERLDVRTILLPADRSREEVSAAAAEVLRCAGRRVHPVSGWEDHDGRFTASWTVDGELIASGHVEGAVLLRTSARPRVAPLVAWAATGVALAGWSAVAGVLVLAALGADVARGWWQSGAAARRTLMAAAAPAPAPASMILAPHVPSPVLVEELPVVWSTEARGAREPVATASEGAR